MMNDRGSGGGSTITQQLAKNMFGRKKKGLLPLLSNKIREIRTAKRLEKVFTKEEILTLYLNTVSFGEMFTALKLHRQGFLIKALNY